MHHLLSLALLFAAPAPAAAPRAADAEKVATKGLEAISKADWKTYADNLHPDSLKAFRDKVVPALKALDEAGKADKEMLGIFDGAKDVKTVLEWKPKEFFVRTMKSLTRYEPTKAMFTMRESKVIGRTLEGKDLAHVVARTTYKIDKTENQYVGVVSLKFDDGKWKLLGDELVMKMADGVKRTCDLHAKEK
jgi:hypothetical protein